MYTALIVIALLFFAAGAVSWALLTFVYKKDQMKAVMVAALLAAIGGGILILNAVIHPGSIQIPEVSPPEISTPHVSVPQVSVPQVSIPPTNR